MPIRTKEGSEEFAHHRDGTSFLQYEFRQSRCLVDASATVHSWERRDRGSKLSRQDNAPLPRIVTFGHGTFPSEQLDVIQRRFAVEGLSEIHTALTQATDRTITDHVAHQAG
ncbi:MAG TPA: hypothetical protein VK650_03320, partial [Steroidobacteraceae bacterium]|nr:hypothetical protein [Steroidobacteraceae bacterium]